ncbi:ESPR domain-containing protein, partial [uncultured Dialister sp.]|uniref:ESPR domain-containing protein n=1 Tax=uncultured Dialister sp. TaxID=278064 RepID=UPI0025966C2D
MNKIYKVIWSKAKHTYVVASEIAKGHTKGETTGRGLKKLAAAMLVAAALLSPSFAWAEGTVTVEPAGTGSTTTVEVYTKGGTDTQVNAAKTYTYRKVAAEEHAREAADNELNERITNEANA